VFARRSLLIVIAIVWGSDHLPALLMKYLDGGRLTNGIDSHLTLTEKKRRTRSGAVASGHALGFVVFARAQRL
jgi:hypothetical protein